ncbi:MAG: hypothetical protein PHF67_00590 [Candidatus Nanoarchaeia archaeon]|nr:hypothetical protein [Candidatus Nanoarchaeia archaeon]
MNDPHLESRFPQRTERDNAVPFYLTLAAFALGGLLSLPFIPSCSENKGRTSPPMIYPVEFKSIYSQR